MLVSESLTDTAPIVLRRSYVRSSEGPRHMELWLLVGRGRRGGFSGSREIVDAWTWIDGLRLLLVDVTQGGR